MTIQLALLADAANISVEGKLNVVGCFDHVKAPTYPASHHGAVLVIKATVTALDPPTSLPVRVALVHNGATLMQRDFPLAVPTIGSELAGSALMIVRMPVIPLPEPGSYVFQISLEGTDGAFVPLTAHLLSESAA